LPNAASVEVENRTRLRLDSALDGGTCESRPTVPCIADAGFGTPLDQQLEDLINKCGVSLSERTVVITFAGGCATHLYFSYPPSPDWPDNATPCFVRELQSSHFACADQTPCWTAAESTLVPVTP
jgi:hypothetical protein